MRSSARGVREAVAAEVAAALAHFNGTKGPEPSDEALWASIAWRIGAENFAAAVRDKLSEDACDGMPRKPAAAFQRFLDKHYPKPSAAARRRP